METEKKSIPNILYLYLHLKIWEYFKSEVISLKDFKNYMFEWRIPKKLRPIVVKELECIGLITRKNRNLVIIKRPTFNVDDCNEYYRELKIF